MNRHSIRSAFPRPGVSFFGPTPWRLLLALILIGCFPADGSGKQSQSHSSGSSSHDASHEIEDRLEECVRLFDDGGLEELINELTSLLSRNPDDETLNLLAAKGYLARCDLRRSKRKTYKLGWNEKRRLRKQQAALAKEGLAFAERAYRSNKESSEINRVLGELTIHQITGPVAGFRFGPNGKIFIEKALELDPTNPEAKRALGLMYLYNPPFNGGDKKKAAETFDQAIRLGGDDRCYVLAARAYLKLKDKKTAFERLSKALEINPNNKEARELLKRVRG